MLSPHCGGSQVFLDLFIKLRTSSASINHVLVIKVTFNPQPYFLLYLLSLTNVTFPGKKKCNYTSPEFQPRHHPRSPGLPTGHPHTDELRRLGANMTNRNKCMLRDKSNKSTTGWCRKQQSSKVSKWEGIPCSQIGRLNIKMSIFLNLIYPLSAISINSPASFFIDINNLSLKFTWEGKTHLIRNNKVKGLTQFQDLL